MVGLAKERYGFSDAVDPGTTFIPFSAMTRMSGVDLNGAQARDGATAPVHTIRKGASDAVAAYVAEHGGDTSHNDELKVLVNGIATVGSTPPVVAEIEAGPGGASDAVAAYVAEHGGDTSHNDELKVLVNGIATVGSTPLVVAEIEAGSDGLTEKARVLGVMELKDIVKGGMRARFDEMRRMGIRTIMITGDNQLTAATIAK